MGLAGACRAPTKTGQALAPILIPYARLARLACDLIQL